MKKKNKDGRDESENIGDLVFLTYVVHIVFSLVKNTIDSIYKRV